MGKEIIPEFHKKLQEMRVRLLGDMGKALKTSKEEEFTELVPDIADDAARSYSRQLILNLGQQDWEKLKLVDEALDKIQTGEYGICQRCEKPIPKARLNIVPFAKYCVKCLSAIEEEEESGKDFPED